jgi:hypothetical protein
MDFAFYLFSLAIVILMLRRIYVSTQAACTGSM